MTARTLRTGALIAAFMSAAAVAVAADPQGPVEAIAAAAKSPAGAEGVFVMRVRGMGRADGNIYLNSSPDYRDQLNLSIALHPESFPGLRARFGNPPETQLRGKVVQVSGMARRLPVYFYSHGVATSKFYYQTQIAVTDARQIAVLPQS